MSEELITEKQAKILHLTAEWKYGNMRKALRSVFPDAESISSASVPSTLIDKMIKQTHVHETWMRIVYKKRQWSKSILTLDRNAIQDWRGDPTHHVRKHAKSSDILLLVRNEQEYTVIFGNYRLSDLYINDSVAELTCLICDVNLNYLNKTTFGDFFGAEIDEKEGKDLSKWCRTADYSFIALSKLPLMNDVMFAEKQWFKTNASFTQEQVEKWYSTEDALGKSFRTFGCLMLLETPNHTFVLHSNDQMDAWLKDRTKDLKTRTVTIKADVEVDMSLFTLV
jgi:hypothetical protein